MCWNCLFIKCFCLKAHYGPIVTSAIISLSSRAGRKFCTVSVYDLASNVFAGVDARDQIQ